MRTRNIIGILTVLFVANMAASSAHAVLVNVNFEAFTPANQNPPFVFATESTLSGPAGGLNTQWNQYADEDSSGVVVDSTGAATTVTFITNFSEGRRGSNANVLPIFNSTLTDFGRTSVARNLTINGLLAGSLHDVYIVAYRDQSTATERLSGTWTSANATTSATSQLLDSTTTQSDLAFLDGVNFIKFSNVQADALGKIVFNAQSTFNPAASDSNNHFRLGLSGFQIQSVAPAVPEPASLTLIGLAAGGLFLRRRRA